LAGIGLWLASNAIPAAWQSWENWVFDRQLRGEPANLRAYVIDMQHQVTGAVGGWLGYAPIREESVSPVRQSAPLGKNALLGRLTIPRLHLNTIVREGTGEETLVLAAGHMRGTALPGGKGNVAVAGHRDTLFSGLAGIRKDDVIEFETLQSSYQYQVSSIEVVSPHDVSVLKASSHPELTLITCYPFDYIGPAPDRFIVKARQVSAGPPQESLAQQLKQKPTQMNVAEVSATTLREKAKPIITEPSATNRTFYLGKRHSQQLAPGISIGLDDTDEAAGQVQGWLWIMPDRRTIWLRDQPVDEPIVFYQNGARRELMITHVTNTSIAGYLHTDGGTLDR
jgi:sortase A